MDPPGDGNLELANAPTSPCYHYIDAAHDCPMYYKLSNLFCVCPSQQAEKEMATHSNVLDWRIPRTREPGGLPSMGSHRVRHDLAAAAWEPVFLIHVSLPLVDCKLHEGRDPTCIIHHCVSSTEPHGDHF